MRILLLSLVFLCCFSIHAQHTALLDSAKRHYDHYQFQAVIDLLEQDVTLTTEGHYLLGKAYQKTGQQEKATLQLKTAFQVDKSKTLYQNELARQFLNTDEHDSALVLYKNLLENNKSNVYYWKQIARIYSEKGEIIPAIHHLQEALQLNADDQESSLRLSNLLVKINLYEAADSIIELQLQKHPKSRTLLNQRLKTAYRLKDYQAVINCAEVLFERLDSALLIQKLAGIAHFHEKNFEQSLVFLEEVVTVEEDSEILHYYLGLAYRELGNMSQSTAHLNQAINAGISENIGNYYTQLAISQEESGDYEGAIKTYQVAYKSSKEKILLYHLARNYDLYYRDKTVALKYYQKYLSENDTANDYYLNYSRYRVQELKAARHFDLDTLN